MVNKCVAAGCSNGPGPGITIHKFPKDPALRKQWEKQVQRKRANWKATDSSVLCSEHFTEDCFEKTAAIAAQFGIARKRKLLPNAVPTIFPRTAATASSKHEVASSSRKRPSTQIPGEAVKRTRSAVEKRERTRVRRSDFLNTCRSIS